ncbi:zeta toxin family protein [Kitasatospora purpeofusca]|uniref:zeta toxin family protein n=1 Tax=Kitasatospora purpeofusca TaxID=67352 RepID=UPI00364E0053
MGEGEMSGEEFSDHEWAEVLERVIVPAALAGAVAQERPVVVLVAGQPGSGKTTLGDLLHAVLDLRGKAVRVGADLYKAAHRRYPALLEEDVRTAGAGVRPDTRHWQAAVEERVREGRFDALVETALADADEVRAQAAAWRAAGYRVEVVALACAEAWSQLGVLARYTEQALATGTGRYVSWENHDTCAAALVESLRVVEEEGLADRVTVVRRGMVLLYGNELVDGAWSRPPGAARALKAERARWWGAAESERFSGELARAERALVRAEDTVPADRVLAVARDGQRAAALAEPVRRIAQALRRPPGVDFHRLSPAEHREIFDLDIVPLLLDGIVARDKPVAVFVVGQPGAGKTGAALMVKRAMRPGTVRLTGDNLKMMHPDYFDLLRSDARGAGEAIRADYKAWMAMAQAHVREHRGDVVIEAAPGDAAEVLAGAGQFHRAGYRVQVLAMAVRAADSRLGTARRFADAQRSGAPARFTSASGHDRCFETVPAVVAAAETSPAVDDLVVTGRDGRALWRRGHSDGLAERALAAERARPYTEPEALMFLASLADLRRALPHHRGELARIAALAHPLLPARLRPVVLVPAATGPAPGAAALAPAYPPVSSRSMSA